MSFMSFIRAQRTRFMMHKWYADDLCLQISLIATVGRARVCWCPLCSPHSPTTLFGTVQAASGAAKLSAADAAAQAAVDDILAEQAESEAPAGAKPDAAPGLLQEQDEDDLEDADYADVESARRLL